MSNYSSPLGNPVVVKDTGDVVVYQYSSETNYTDEERVLDDRSLAAHDALKLDDGYADQDEPYDAQVRKRRRRRRLLLVLAMCLLLGIIVLTSVLASNKNKSSREVSVGDGSGVDSVEGGGFEQVFPTAAPAEASAQVTDAPSVVVVAPQTNAPTAAGTTSSPTDAPVETAAPTSDAALQVLGSQVFDSSKLLDPTTPEGQAYLDVAQSGLTDPQEILQQYSLLTFYYASNGDGWVQKGGWNAGSNECTWRGVGCNGSGQVTSISLSNNRLMGTIPHDVCLLTDVQHFIVPANDLVGALPDCFGDMTNLMELHVTGNFLDTLPTNLHELPNLTRLSLASNNFGGNMNQLFRGARTGVPMFPQLRTLDLHSNNLVGRVPDSTLASIGTLKAVNIANNPDMFGSLDTMCDSVRLYLAQADCSIACECCSGCS